MLTPNDFTSVAEVEDRLLEFQIRYEAVATPFQWAFIRRDLMALLANLTASGDRFAGASLDAAA